MQTKIKVSFESDSINSADLSRLNERLFLIDLNQSPQIEGCFSRLTEEPDELIEKVQKVFAYFPEVKYKIQRIVS